MGIQGSGLQELRLPNPADCHAVEPKTCDVVGMSYRYLGSGDYTARANRNVNTSAP